MKTHVKISNKTRDVVKSSRSKVSKSMKALLYRSTEVKENYDKTILFHENHNLSRYYHKTTNNLQIIKKIANQIIL